MGSDPVFLLSNIEMARVHWRQGPNANELVVEVNNEIDAEPDEVQQAMELRNLDYATTTEKTDYTAKDSGTDSAGKREHSFVSCWGV